MFWNNLLYIGPIVLMVLFFIWYITCTRHRNVPLIIPIFLLILGFVPLLGLFVLIMSCFIFILSKDSLGVELKNNWINRTFFAYHAE